MRKTDVLVVVLLFISCALKSQDPIIIDHTSRVLSDIPERWIDSAKQNLHIGYGHTSHGSQIPTGMNALEAFFSDGTYNWSNSGGVGELRMFEGNMWSQNGYLGQDVGSIGWDDETREYLNDYPDCNVIIWAWCGLENTVVDRDVMSHYLQPMNQLEQEYPNVHFVYMTGPLNGLGPNGAVKQANDSIREFCQANNKILYDFADIEKYDPDANTDYQLYGADDECAYDPDGEYPYDQTENWAENWISQNPDDTLTLLTSNANSDDCSFGHTHCLNCVLKGIAAWQLWARIAGWEKSSEPPVKTSSFTASSGSWNDPNNWDNGIPDTTITAEILENNSVTINNNAQCSTLTIQSNARVTIMDGDTLFTENLTLNTASTYTSTGQLLNYGTVLSTNESTIEKYTTSNKFNNASSPVINSSSKTFNANNEELFFWDVSLKDYQQINDNTTTLDVMRGYLFRNASSDTTIIYKGAINQGEQSFNLEINIEDTLYRHWNLTGNPFAAPLDWNSTDWVKDNIANSIYFHQETSDQPCAYVNGITIPQGCFDGIIDPMGAFWVHANNSGNLSVGKNAQISAKTSSGSSKQTIQKGIKLSISDNGSSYETLLRFDNSASLGFDSEYDAYHLNVPEINKSISPGLYFLESDTNKLAINTIPESQKFRLYLGFAITNSGEHVIEASELINFNSSIFLIDKITGDWVDLSQTNYTFSASNGIHKNRFAITTMEPVVLDDAIIIDHTSRVLSDIPERWIDSAKQNLHIGYGHTSHGSQIPTGMNALETFFSDGTYNWSNSGGTGELHLFEGNMWSQNGYLGEDVGSIGWDDETREYLDDYPDCNVIIWAWCGLENTVVDRDVMSHYLQPMNQLEQEYPNVHFVYMTGPLNGLGPNGAVKQANDSIREFCQTNNKILYDFADIEKYDPDANTDYQLYGADDECAYDPDGEYPYDQTENWAENWISQNPDDTLTLLTSNANSDDCSFGHTHCLNCVLKGIAAWQLWARIAGWEKSSEPPVKTSSFTASSGNWNDQNNWDNGIPDTTITAIILQNNSVTIDNNAQCSTLTVKPGGIVTVMEGDTLITEHITLETHTNDSTTAKLLNYGWIISTNGISIEKYINRNTWENISPPVSNETSMMFNATEEELFYWDASVQEHIKIADNTTNLHTMNGYHYRNSSSDTTIMFNGQLNQGRQEHNLFINTQDTTSRHWNLIGNPYPSPIDWDHSSWDKANVANSIYFKSKNSDQYHTYVNGISNPEGTSNGIIPEMKGFWVYAKANGTIAIEDSAQKLGIVQKKSFQQKADKIIRLGMSNNESEYEAVIIFNNQASSGFDPLYDAFHLDIPQIGFSYSPGLFSIDSNSNLLAINNLPENKKISIPLGYTIINSGQYTLSLNENTSMNDTLYLTDMEEEKTTRLSDNNYSFIATRGNMYNRFTLTNEMTDTITQLKNPVINKPFDVYAIRKSVIILSNKTAKARVRIINIIGKTMYDNKIVLDRNTKIPLESSGIHIVLIKTDDIIQSEKVFLK